MRRKSPYLVKPESKVRLVDLSTDSTGDLNHKAAAESLLKDHRKRLEALQELLYASQAKALLIVLQGMDTAGKDGTIRHIFSGINPQGCSVASFKVPTALEARHDFLWRCQLQVPPRGMIGIFNRSHYEDVLSPRVHGKLSPKQAREHMDDINAWERTLANNDVVILKFFLHISHAEQTERLQARIDTPDKHWKLSPSDFEERPYWADYMEAYEEIFERTSHKHAPWFIIPADHKWYRDVAISNILLETLGDLQLQYPPATFDPSGLHLNESSATKIADEVEGLAKRAGSKQSESKRSGSRSSKKQD